MTWPIAATDHVSTKNFPGAIDDYSFKMMVGSRMPIPGHAYTNQQQVKESFS